MRSARRAMRNLSRTDWSLEAKNSAESRAWRDKAWATFFETLAAAAPNERPSPEKAWAAAAEALQASAAQEWSLGDAMRETPREEQTLTGFSSILAESHAWLVRGLAMATENAEAFSSDCGSCGAKKTLSETASASAPSAPVGLTRASTQKPNSGRPETVGWMRECWRAAMSDQEAFHALFGEGSTGPQRGLAAQALAKLAGVWAKSPENAGMARELLARVPLDARESQAIAGFYGAVCEENHAAVLFYLNEWALLGWDWREHRWANGHCLSPFSCVASLPMARWMIEQGMDARWTDPKTGRGALWSASYWDCIQVLLVLGNNPNEKDAQGVTPFMAFAALEWLEKGTEVQNPQGLLAGLEKTARGYLAAGADADTKDREGRSIAQILQQNASSINAGLRGGKNDVSGAAQARAQFAQMWVARLEALLIEATLQKRPKALVFEITQSAGRATAPRQANEREALRESAWTPW